MFDATKKKKEKLSKEGKTVKNSAIKFGAYPTNEQCILLNKTFGCARLVYNLCLEYKKRQYDLYKVNISYGEMEWRIVNIIKQSEEYSFLKEVDKFAITSAIANLFTAYDNFFNHKAGFPQFKSKQNSHQSYKTKFTNNNIALLQDGKSLYVKLPKVGKVAVRMSSKNKDMQKVLNGHARITSATVSRDSNFYYISIGIEEVIDIVNKPTTIRRDEIAAGDLGIKTLIDLYDGENHDKVENPKWTNKNAKKTRRLQKSLSRKQKGSKNRAKAKKKLAKHHTHVANKRRDFNHKLSRKIVNENQVYVSEDLAIINMVKNHKLSKAILSCGWGQLQGFIKYKIENNGGYYIEVDQFFPSSKTCRHCGHKNTELTLKDREWVCPHCGSHLDRDENASETLYDEGIRILKEMGVTIV